MHFLRRFAFATLSVPIIVFGCSLAGCQFASPDRALKTDSTAVSDSISVTSAQILKSDTAVVSVSDSSITTLTDSLNAAPLSTDSLTVAVPSALLDSLLRELASLKAAVITDSTQSTDDADLQDQLTSAVGGIQHLGRNILLSILTILTFFYIIRTLAWTLERFSEQSATRRLFFKRLVPIVRILFWSLAIYIILIPIFGLTDTQLISAWAAIGLAVGFASQDILKNIFGGIIIIIDQPFQVGDKINIGGTYGEVTSIGLRSTRIVTPDDNLVSVPNAQVVESQVANANAGALDCQVVIDLYLPGWVDVLEAKAIAYDAAANSNYVYLDKPIVVNIKDVFKETFLTHLAVKAYVLDTRYEFAFASDVTETAKAEFQRKGMLPPMANVLAIEQNKPSNGSSNLSVEKP